MQDALEIQDIRLRQLGADAITPAMATGADAWYELTVTTYNAAAESLWALSDVRRVDYDAGARALTVEFSERHVPAAAHRRRQLPANFVEVKAGERTALTHRMSSPLIFTDAAGPRATPRFVRLPADVDVIRCAVAFDTAPPRQVTNLASHEISEDVRQWGRVVERSIETRGEAAS